eukprot:scaffold27238_cov31-Tisochrysis_lutea.AAC.4
MASFPKFAFSFQSFNRSGVTLISAGPAPRARARGRYRGCVEAWPGGRRPSLLERPTGEVWWIVDVAVDGFWLAVRRVAGVWRGGSSAHAWLGWSSWRPGAVALATSECVER